MTYEGSRYFSTRQLKAFFSNYLREVMIEIKNINLQMVKIVYN